MAPLILRLVNALYCVIRRTRSISRPRRILVVKLDGIGDFVLSTPLLRELKRSFPSASITLVVSPLTAPLVELCPYVDRVMLFDPHSLAGEPKEEGRFRAWLFAITLWRYRFDLAVLPRWDSDFYYGYYLLCGSGARHIAGYSRTMRAVRNTWLSRAEKRCATILDTEMPEHEVRRNLRFVGALGGAIASDELELWVSPDDRARAAEWVAQLGDPPSRPIVAFGIGAGDPARCWPEERFAVLGRVLGERHDARVILVGSGKADQARAERVLRLAGQSSISSAVGLLSLRETVALLTRCHLFVGNDSGPMHLAAAAGMPVVEVSGLPEHEDPNSHFSPVRFGPWTRFARVVRPQGSVQMHRHAPGDLCALSTRNVSLPAVCEAIEDLLAAMPIDAAAPFLERA